jgi:hypothetical protein
MQGSIKVGASSTVAHEKTPGGIMSRRVIVTGHGDQEPDRARLAAAGRAFGQDRKPTSVGRLEQLDLASDRQLEGLPRRPFEELVVIRRRVMLPNLRLVACHDRLPRVLGGERFDPWPGMRHKGDGRRGLEHSAQERNPPRRSQHPAQAHQAHASIE